MSSRKFKKREFTFGGLTVKSYRYRSAKRIARAVARGEMTPEGRTYSIAERALRKKAAAS